MNNNCGCNNKANNKNADREFLMVEAAASEANNCSTKNSSLNDSSACAKQEPTFDTLLSSFVIPDNIGNVNVTVCNGNVYTPSQWLQFTSPYVALQITAVNGNVITLENSCPDGSIVDGNAPSGQIVPRNTIFFPVSSPPCLSVQERIQQLDPVIAAKTQICTPLLDQTSETAEVQVVGRVEQDPGDTSYEKCIKRVYGFLFKAGTPIFSQIKAVAEADINQFRRLGINKTSREVKELPNLWEYSGIDVNKQYTPSITTAGEKVIGPTYGVVPIDRVLYTKGSGSKIYPSSPTMVTMPSNVEDIISVAGVTEITSIRRNQDHYYLEININGYHNSGAQILLYLNGSYFAMISDLSESSGTYVGFNISHRVRLTNADTQFRLRFYNAVGISYGLYAEVQATKVLI